MSKHSGTFEIAGDSVQQYQQSQNIVAPNGFDGAIKLMDPIIEMDDFSLGLDDFSSWNENLPNEEQSNQFLNPFSNSQNNYRAPKTNIISTES